MVLWLNNSKIYLACALHIIVFAIDRMVLKSGQNLLLVRLAIQLARLVKLYCCTMVCDFSVHDDVWILHEHYALSKNSTLNNL